MSKSLYLLLSCAVALGATWTGCAPESAPEAASDSTVSGYASTDVDSAIIALKDSSVPARERTTTIDGSGYYSMNVSDLTPPYLLKADALGASGSAAIYAIAARAGTVDINPLTHAVIAAAANESGSTPDDRFERPAVAWTRQAADRFGPITAQLRTSLSPLLERYGIGAQGQDAEALRGAIRAMLLEVRFAVQEGRLLVTNRATGAVIFSAPLNDLAAGAFQAENMPGTSPAPTPCSYTYSPWGACQSDGTQARSATAGTPTGCTGSPVLTQTCTYVPPSPTACSYTYSAWGACQSTGTQSRSVAAAAPAGCSGTPVLSQACTYAPPSPTACTYTYSAWAACQPNGTQTRSVTSSSPAGCTGSPTLSRACTYVPPPPAACTYTYSAWGACQANGTQTRTVTSTSPAGCSGTPVLSQGCTYSQPLDGAALYRANCYSCHGDSEKGASAAATKAAIDSNKGGMGSVTLRALTPEQLQAIANAP